MSDQNKIIINEKAPAMRDAGADIFVGGTSSVFSGDLTESIGNVRELLK